MPASSLQRLALGNSASSRVSVTSKSAGACPVTLNSKKVRKPSTPESRAKRSKIGESRLSKSSIPMTNKAVPRFTSSQKAGATDVAHMNSPVRIQWKHNKDDGSTHVSFMDPDIWNLDKVEKDPLLQVAAHTLNSAYAASDLYDVAVLKSRKKKKHRSRSELTEMGLKAVFDRYPTPGGYVLNEVNKDEDARPSDFWLSRKQDGTTTIGSLKPESSASIVYPVPDLNRDPDENLDRDLLNQNFGQTERYLKERSGYGLVDWGSQTAKVEGTASLVSLLPDFNPLNFTAAECRNLRSLVEGVDAWCPNESAEDNRRIRDTFNSVNC